MKKIVLTNYERNITLSFPQYYSFISFLSISYFFTETGSLTFKICLGCGAESTGIPSSFPVSYTHLDVYKRQSCSFVTFHKHFCHYVIPLSQSFFSIVITQSGHILAQLQHPIHDSISVIIAGV